MPYPLNSVQHRGPIERMMHDPNWQKGLRLLAGREIHSRASALRLASMLCLALGALTLTLLSPGPALGETLASEPGDMPVTEQPAPPEISRDAWRVRIEEARRRAKEIALDRRLHPEKYAPPPPEDPARIATQRVLRDDSLQPGDIISTDKGLFVYRGRPDQPRGDGDFVALPAR